MQELEAFIVEAKAAAYIGGGAAGASSRPASHDLIHANGSWRYLDSYYGGTDFLGQEVVWFEDRPVWAMNYYGRVLDGQLIDGERAGRVIKASLTMMYREKRFLGGFRNIHEGYEYYDESNGDLRSFNGVERIFCNGTEAYRLDYHGGMIVP